MPTFGLDDQNLNGVISYFGAVSNKMGAFRSHEAYAPWQTTTPAKCCSTC